MKNLMRFVIALGVLAVVAMPLQTIFAKPIYQAQHIAEEVVKPEDAEGEDLDEEQMKDEVRLAADHKMTIKDEAHKIDEEKEKGDEKNAEEVKTEAESKIAGYGHDEKVIDKEKEKEKADQKLIAEEEVKPADKKAINDDDEDDDDDDDDDDEDEV